MPGFKLRFDPREIGRWAAKYPKPELDDEPIRIGERTRTNKVLTKADFVVIARWKSTRPSKQYHFNDDQFVQEVSRVALTTDCERLRLSAFTLLSGVADRTASVFLHLCHADPYPIMDVRAFWSLGLEHAPKNWSAIWPEYTGACRHLCAESGVSMRVLDRALWAYSNEKGQVAK